MNKILQVFTAGIFMLCQLNAYSQMNWPLPPFNTQKRVTGTIGEVRGSVGDERFHRGLDITNGTNYNIYAIEGGTLTYHHDMIDPVNSYITVSNSNGSILYIHTNSSVSNGEVTAGQFIGTMKNQLAIHLHLQSNNYNFLSTRLFPYVDNVAPTIHFVNFKQNGCTINNSTPNFSQVVNVNSQNHIIIYNKIDVIAKVSGPGVSTNGSANERTVAPYSVSYEIFDNSNNSIDGSAVENILFEQIPNNNAAPFVFGNGSNETVPVYIYILTSHPRLMPYDRYWNTALRMEVTENWQNSNALDARCNDEAKYSDGQYAIQIKARDVDYNQSPSLITQQTSNVLIDNFRPYIKTVEMHSAGSPIYSAGWEWNSPSAINTFGPNSLSGIAPNNSALITTITTSEPMQSVSLNIGTLGFSNTSASPVAGSNRKQWQFTISTSTIAQASSCLHTLSINGVDLAGNPIQSNPAIIPKRNLDGTWSPAPQAGSDTYHGFSTSAGLGLTLSSTPATAPNFQNGTVTATITQGQPTYSYGFLGPFSGNFSSNQATSTITNLVSGIYHVTVTSGNGCSATGSVSVLNENTPQPCLSGGITFSTQAQIDAFSVNYPGCTQILGSVTISGAGITNLSGLSSLTMVGGYLYINNNTSLTDLDGLSSLAIVGGHLIITNNTSLTDLDGLSSLSMVGGYLSINDNASLTNITGLNALNSVEFLQISSNAALTTISGFNMLPSIPQGISINTNNLLTSIEEFNILTSVGSLWIFDNGALTSMFGFNMITSIEGSLLIASNNSLTNLMGLNSLTSVEGFISINHNDALTSLTGLNELTSVRGFTFQIHNNGALTSLEGLNSLTSVEGFIYLVNNMVLTSLEGLNSLTNIGGDLYIALNNALISLDGLNVLNSIGESLWIEYNNALSSLSALNGLNTIGSFIRINSNPQLISLTGIDNVDPYAITDLFIQSSNMLSMCDVQSICDYLAIPSNPATISGNANGCANRVQVEATCEGCSHDNTSPIFYVTDVLGNILADNDPLTAAGTSINFGTVPIPEGECARQDEYYVYGFDNCDGFIQALNAVSTTAVTVPNTIIPGTQVSVTPDGFGFYLVDVLWSVGASTVTVTGRDAADNPAYLTLIMTIQDNIPPVASCTNQTITFNGQPGIALNPANLVTTSDNCSVQSITLSPTSIICAQIGTVVPVTATVTDANGNATNCVSQVTVTGLPCGWNQQPNGINCNNGNAVSYNPVNQIYSVTSTNCYYSDPFASDAMAFNQRTLCGDGSITAQVASLTGTGWAGVVMRETNEAGAKKVQLMTSLSSLSRREVRYTNGGASYPQLFVSNQRFWLRIVRQGSQFTAYTSPNGVQWYQVMSTTVDMTACIEMGLAVTNNQPTGTVTATFANVSTTGNSSGLLPPGINEQLYDPPLTLDFSLFPNPTTGEINIDLSAYSGRPVSVALYTPQGQQLRFVEIQEVQAAIERLDLADYANGMYWIKVKTPGLPDTTKRVVLTGHSDK